MAKNFNITAQINAKVSSRTKNEIDALRRRIQGIKGKVTIDVSGAAQGKIKALNASIQQLNNSLKVTASLSKGIGTGFKTMGAKTATAVAPLNKVATSAKKASTSVKTMAKSTKMAVNEIEEFGRVSGLAIRRFAGFTIATTIVFGLARSISSAFSEAIKFQREMVRVAQVTKTSVGALSGLQKEITRLSTGLGVASKDLIGVSRILAQTGLSAHETKVALEALAKSELAPTFSSIEKTAEGAIAIMRQFEIGAGGLEKALGSINAVAGQFAVESDDIIAAVRRAGGVFAAASKGVSEGQNALNEFIAVFTSVRATTRESAESIATGLRTIFTRMQRSSTIVELERLGIKLTDTEGKFVGAYKAINILGDKLRTLDPRDVRFSQIAENLGGFRQISKVIPLISQYETRMKALEVAQGGYKSLTKDAEKAQEALAVQFTKTREEFIALVREFSNSDTFKYIIAGTLRLTSTLIRLVDAFKPLLPLIAAFAAVKGIGLTSMFLNRRGFIAGLKGSAGPGGKGFADGGLVPGGKGTKDDFPARLMRGEYVIRQKAVDKLGVDYLNALNHGYAGGGLRRESRVGGALLKPAGLLKTSPVTINPEEVPALDLKAPLTYNIVRQGLPTMVQDSVSRILKNSVGGGIQNAAFTLGGKKLSGQDTNHLLKTVDFASMSGNMFEGMLLQIGAEGTFDRALKSGRPFDFVGGAFAAGSKLSKHYPSLAGISYVDAKFNQRVAEPAEFKSKIIDQLNLERGLAKESQGKGAGRKKTQAGLEKEAAAKAKRKAKALAKLRRGYAGGGQITAMDAVLTRGEYVMGRKAVDNLGVPFMNRLNNADKGAFGFAFGGPVGRFRDFRKDRSPYFQGFGTQSSIITDPGPAAPPFNPGVSPGRARAARSYRPESIGGGRPMGQAAGMQQSVAPFVPPTYGLSPANVTVKQRKHVERNKKRNAARAAAAAQRVVKEAQTKTKASLRQQAIDSAAYHSRRVGVIGQSGTARTARALQYPSGANPPSLSVARATQLAQATSATTFGGANRITGPPNIGSGISGFVPSISLAQSAQKLNPSALKNAQLGLQDAGFKLMQNKIQPSAQTLQKSMEKLNKEYARLVPQVGKEQAATLALNTAKKTLQTRYNKLQQAGGFGGRVKRGFGAIGEQITRDRSLTNLRGQKGFSQGINPFKSVSLGSLGFIAPLAAGLLDKKGTSSVAQGLGGAGAGAGFASALGLGPAGIIAGGAFGAVSGIQSAEAADARAQADTNLADSTKTLDEAMKDLSANGVAKLNKAFEKFEEATIFAARAIVEERQGFLGGVSDELGNVQGKTSFGTRFAASSFNVGGVFGDNTKAQAKLSRQILTANQQDFLKLQQQSAAGGTAAAKLSNIRGKKLTDDQLKQLGLQGLTTASVSSGTKGFTLSDDSDARKALQKGREIDAENKRRLAVEADMRNSIRQSATALEDVTTTFKTMEAIAKRAAQEGAAFAESIRLIGKRRGGQVGLRDFTSSEQNVFANPLAFNKSEFAGAGQRLMQRTGGVQNGRVDTALRFAQGGVELEKRIERVIANTAASQQSQGLAIDSTTNERAIQNAIANEFSDVPERLIDSLNNQILKALRSRQSAGLEGLLDNDIGKTAVAGTSKAAIDSLKAIYDAEVKIRKDFNKGLEAEANYQLGIIKQQADIDAKAIDAQNKLAESFGTALSITQKTAPLTSNVSALTTKGGLGGITNTQGIISGIQGQKALQAQIEGRAARIRGAGGDDREQQKQLAVLGMAIQANTSAVNMLASDTTKLAAIQSEVATIEKAREDASKSLMDLMQGGFKDQVKFQQRLNVLGQFLKDPTKLSSKQQAQAATTASELGPLANVLFPKQKGVIAQNLQTATATATAPFFAGALNLRKRDRGRPGGFEIPGRSITKEEAEYRAKQARSAKVARARGNFELARQNEFGARGFDTRPGSMGRQVLTSLGPNAAQGLKSQAQLQIENQRQLSQTLSKLNNLPSILQKLEATLNLALQRLGTTNNPGAAPAPNRVGAFVPDQMDINVTHQFDVNLMGAEGLDEGVKTAAVQATNDALRRMGMNPIDGSIEATPMRGIT